MSLFLLTNAGGSALGIILSPIFSPKNFQILFYSFSGGMVVLALVFWKYFRYYDSLVGQGDAN